MRRVINRKVYDTEKAKEIHSWNNGYSCGDYYYEGATLYKTPKGEYFRVVESYEKYGKVETFWSRIIVFEDEEEVIDWLERHDGSEIIVDEFPEYVEEA